MIQETQPSPKALVLYDSVFGNTEKIARALSRGIQRHCIVDCLNIRDADPKKFAEYGLIAIGAPTQAHSAYKPMKDFLSGLEGMKDLAGVPGFALTPSLTCPFPGARRNTSRRGWKNLVSRFSRLAPLQLSAEG